MNQNGTEIERIRMGAFSELSEEDFLWRETNE
jgi:hypothetical protein